MKSRTPWTDRSCREFVKWQRSHENIQNEELDQLIISKIKENVQNKTERRDWEVDK